MKKILLLIMFFVLATLVAIGQKDTTKHPMLSQKYETKGGRGYTIKDSTDNPFNYHEKSNYEKYWEEKNGSLDKSSTITLTKKEYDDLYYIPSKDDLKRKEKDIRLRKKEIRMVQDSLYYDAKKEVYNDLYYNNYYPDYRFRLYFGFRPYYYYGGWYDPFFYDPWYYDYWYVGYLFYYPYYNHYYYPYHSYWYGNSFYHNNYYYYGHNNYSYTSNNINTARREGYSTTTNISNRHVPQKPETRSIVNPAGSTNNIESRRTTANVSTQQRQTYNETRREYSPSYTTPRTTIRPEYNTTKVQNRSNFNSNYSTPIERRSSPTINTPSRSNNMSQSRSSYNVPSRSNYSAPTQNRSSYNNGSSNYRSTPSINRPSSGSYGGGNFSGGSNSGGGRSSSGTVSGTRR